METRKDSEKNMKKNQTLFKHRQKNNVTKYVNNYFKKRDQNRMLFFNKNHQEVYIRFPGKENIQSVRRESICNILDWFYKNVSTHFYPKSQNRCGTKCIKFMKKILDQDYIRFEDEQNARRSQRMWKHKMSYSRKMEDYMKKYDMVVHACGNSDYSAKFAEPIMQFWEQNSIK